MVKFSTYIILLSIFTLGLGGCFRSVPTAQVTHDGAVNVFEQYDFSSGEYELFGVYWSDFERNSLADSIGTFSLKDPNLLNELKSSWNLTPAPEKKCGYDYKIYIAKGDSIVSTSFLNIRCESIMVDGVGYKFEREKIANLYGKTDSIETVRVVFYGQDMAIDYLEGMRADPNMFVLDNGGYVWEKYVGYFEVTYSNTEVGNSGDALLALENEIKSEYPTDSFELESVGSNIANGTYKIRVYCHAEFLDDFKLYPILKPYTYIINYSMTGFKRL